jgi:diaminohydroxyphosphoribosylaminopyrimidine deaminase / 5-amino-6-(5-phosphoribosylamino)uracil reductase
MNPDEHWMRRALRLAAKGRGRTSPNPCVGAVIVKGEAVLGEGWHRQAGGPHAEVAALANAAARGNLVRGATIYVTLEPCSTTGRTPPCTKAIIKSGLRRVVVGAIDPNPEHAGRALKILERQGIETVTSSLTERCSALNESFNHWIIERTPFVVAKAAMTLDGKIATEGGESKWITGPEAGKEAMRLRFSADAIIAGVNTILADDPSLTCRDSRVDDRILKPIRRLVLDTRGRTPMTSRVVSDAHSDHTIIVVGRDAPAIRVDRLRRRVEVWRAPVKGGHINLKWLLRRLGRESVTHLLIEGGGEVNGSFFDAGLVNRVAFFYAPKILGGDKSRRGVGGAGFDRLGDVPRIRDPKWRRLGEDLYLTGLVER